MQKHLQPQFNLLAQPEVSPAHRGAFHLLSRSLGLKCSKHRNRFCHHSKHSVNISAQWRVLHPITGSGKKWKVGWLKNFRWYAPITVTHQHFNFYWTVEMQEIYLCTEMTMYFKSEFLSLKNHTKNLCRRKGLKPKNLCMCISPLSFTFSALLILRTEMHGKSSVTFAEAVISQHI